MRSDFIAANERRKQEIRSAQDLGYGATGAANAAANRPVTQADLQGLLRMVASINNGQPATLQALLATGNRQPQGPPPPPPLPQMVLHQHPDGRWYYCWTHGLSNNPQHTSATCTSPAEGHQRTATIDNMLGGNNSIRRRRNERAIYRRPQRNQNTQG
jgi:hypothetical protein